MLLSHSHEYQWQRIKDDKKIIDNKITTTMIAI